MCLLNNNIDTARTVLLHLPELLPSAWQPSNNANTLVLPGESQARYADYVADIVPLLKSLNQRMRGRIARNLRESPTVCLDLARHISDNRVLAKLAAIKIGSDAQKVHPFFAPYLLTDKYPADEDFNIELTDIKKVIELHEIKPLILDGRLTLEAVANLTKRGLSNLACLNQVVLKEKIDIERAINLSHVDCNKIANCKELLLLGYLSAQDIFHLTSDELWRISHASKNFADLIVSKKLNFDQVKRGEFDIENISRIEYFSKLILEGCISVDEILALTGEEYCKIEILYDFIAQGSLTIDQVKALKGWSDGVYVAKSLAALKGLVDAGYLTIDYVESFYNDPGIYRCVLNVIKPLEKLILEKVFTLEEVEKFPRETIKAEEYSQLSKLIMAKKIGKDNALNLIFGASEDCYRVCQLADLILNDKISVEDAKKVESSHNLSLLSGLILSERFSVREVLSHLGDTSLYSFIQRLLAKLSVLTRFNLTTYGFNVIPSTNTNSVFWEGGRFMPEMVDLVLHNYLTLHELCRKDFSSLFDSPGCMKSLLPYIIAGKITMEQAKNLTSDQVYSLRYTHYTRVYNVCELDLIGKGIISLEWREKIK